MSEIRAVEENWKRNGGLWGDCVEKKRDAECGNVVPILKWFRWLFVCVDVDRIGDFIEKYFRVTG